MKSHLYSQNRRTVPAIALYILSLTVPPVAAAVVVKNITNIETLWKDGYQEDNDTDYDAEGAEVQNYALRLLEIQDGTAAGTHPQNEAGDIDFIHVYGKCTKKGCDGNSKLADGKPEVTDGKMTCAKCREEWKDNTVDVVWLFQGTQFNEIFPPGRGTYWKESERNEKAKRALGAAVEQIENGICETFRLVGFSQGGQLAAEVFSKLIKEATRKKVTTKTAVIKSFTYSIPIAT